MSAGSRREDAHVLVARIKKAALIATASALSLLGIIVALYLNLIPGVNVTVSKVDRDYLIDSFTSGKNKVDIYQHDGKVCADTYSTSKADIPHQTCVTTARKIVPSDITLDWFTLNGGAEKVEAGHPNTTSVHILIKEGETVVFEHHESFIEKLTDAFNDGLNMHPAPEN